MFSKLLSALPFSHPKSTPKEPSNTHRSPFKVSGLGRRVKKVFRRSHSEKKNAQCLKAVISAPVQIKHASTMVASAGMQAYINDPLVFENPRELHLASAAITSQPESPTPDSSTTASHRTSSPQPGAELMPTQWLRLGRARQSGRSWNWRDERELPKQQDPANGGGLPASEEERKSANRRSPTQSLVSETTASLPPTTPPPAPCHQIAARPKPSPEREVTPMTREVASWSPEWELEMKPQRYSATAEELTKLEEESEFIKWDGLFSPAPDDNDRQGRRARARGIMSWAIPITETAAKPELPVRRSASAATPISEKERSKRRR